MLPATCSSWDKAWGMCTSTSTIHKPHLLVTHFLLQIIDPAQLHWAIRLFREVKLRWWLATLQHIPCIFSAFDGNSTTLEYWPMPLKCFAWCSSLLQNSDGVAHQSSAQPFRSWLTLFMVSPYSSLAVQRLMSDVWCPSCDVWRLLFNIRETKVYKYYKLKATYEVDVDKTGVDKIVIRKARVDKLGCYPIIATQPVH